MTTQPDGALTEAAATEHFTGRNLEHHHRSAGATTMTYHTDEDDPSFPDAIVDALHDRTHTLTVKALVYGGVVVGTEDGRTAVKIDPVEPNTAADPDAANDPAAVALTIHTRNPAGGKPLATLGAFTVTAMTPAQVAAIITETFDREYTERMDELAAACYASGAGWVRAWGFWPSKLTAQADGDHNGRVYRLTVSYLRGDWSWRLTRDDKKIAGDSAIYPAGPATAAEAVTAALLAYAHDTAEQKHLVVA